MRPKSTIATWDLPTRLFHWALVGLFINAYLTFEFGDVNMTYHMWNGYAILTLCLYRLFWGIIGSNTARFSNFIKGPKAVLSYLTSLIRPPSEKHLGHNPVGGLMVIALLMLLLGQGTMGLFTSDEIIVEGPLVFIASDDWVSLAGTLHRVGFWVILGFVGLHVSAAFFYLLFKKENLIRAMITGRKQSHTVPISQSLEKRPLYLAALCLGLAAGCVWLALNIWHF
ncbi:Cytochrome B561, bacterial [Candidatus Terasakiella magnetica]|uniref:Cytochrome B561, bacterial n=1 Tax=Candidatus Terasakiella magnetica TaxID=1867952 RepID=A0A1C3RD07_9PROT|nr:cytochrome b/b6 domain-containing protein [Candidatus Terasakiella magnetica]SCA55148.1 Cytochrome B561, bacterial [Candidatus Terasakiella magnetica]